MCSRAGFGALPAAATRGARDYPIGDETISSSVEVKLAFRSSYRFLLRLLKRLFKPFRERISPVPFVSHRLLEQRLTPRPLLREDLLRAIQLWLVLTLRFLVRNDAFQARVNGLHRPTARTNHFEFR